MARRYRTLLAMLAVISSLLVGCAATIAPPSPVSQNPIETTRTATSIPRPVPTATPPPPTQRPRIATTPFPTLALSPEPASNFAFTFGYGACQPITRTLNTYNNTLTQQSHSGDPVTVPFQLTDAEQRAIYRKMVDINIFSYPATFSIPVLPGEMYTASSTYPRYTFTARNGDREVSVQWDDEIWSPTTTEADNLRSLIDLLKRTIEQHPDLQQLPPLQEVCA